MPRNEFKTIETNWTDLPLHQVLYEWIAKNLCIPTDMSTIVAYIGLILIVWYTLIWLTRFIISIIWPVFLIASAIIAFRILQFYEPEDLADMFFKSLTVVADTLVRARFIYNYTLHQSVRIYKNFCDFVMLFYYFLFGVEKSEETEKDESIDDIFMPEETFHIN